ncbi:aminotransferase class I/II-fold pyridoxal phosphate-dependent enzyme, partial [Clostridioides difficile]|nr:aminotransferase class I/II-fold pyridoxal phosphate-dependent enzyme [Clostridioides difficile]
METTKIRYNFDEVIDRSGTNCLKYDLKSQFMPESPEDALPLWVADMDFACAPEIINAMHERIDRKIFGYSSQQTDDYYEAVCGWFKRRFDWKIEKENIFFSPGVVPALGFFTQILTQKGDGIIIEKPVYYPFEDKITNNERKVVNSPLKFEDGHYSMD